MNIFENPENTRHTPAPALKEKPSFLFHDHLPFITISREAGAGGHSLSDAIFKGMNNLPDIPLFQQWKSFDLEIHDMMERNTKLRTSIEALVAEHIIKEAPTHFSQLFPEAPPQSEKLREMAIIIRGLALRGKVIVVGRGGACLTRHLPGGIHIRLVASRKTRIRKMTQLLEIASDQAEKIVDLRDAARSELIRTVFGRKIDDSLLYDMIWNTDITPISTIAATILRLMQYRQRELFH